MKRLHAYLWLIFVLDPFTSIFRQMGMFNTAILTNIYGTIGFFIILPEALKTYYVKNDFFMKTLITGLLIGSIIGIKNQDIQDFLRNYLADTFNILKAILIYSFGKSFNQALVLDERFNKIVKYSLISSALATVVLIWGLNTGLVGYLSGPGYTLLLPLSFYANSNTAATVVSFLLILLSTKRGAIIMAIGVIAVSLILGKKYIKSIKRSRFYFNMVLIIGAAFLLLSLVINNDIISWVDSRLQTLAATFDYKVMSFIDADYTDVKKLDNLGSNRISEAQSAFNSMSSGDWIWGAGHGFSYYYYDDYSRVEVVHNVHFSPLSLAIRYGVVIAFLIYYNFISLILRGIYWSFKLRNFNLFKVPLLYLLGATIYSFTAYSIMNDLLFMFMAGHLYSMLSTLKRQPKKTPLIID